MTGPSYYNSYGTSKRQNIALMKRSCNVSLMEKLSSWYEAKCMKKYLWNSERCYTLFYCDVSTPLVRDVFKRTLYKDLWRKAYLTSALSWVRFHVTSVHHFYEKGCPCVSVKRFHPSDLITECPCQTFPFWFLGLFWFFFVFSLVHVLQSTDLTNWNLPWHGILCW